MKNFKPFIIAFTLIFSLSTNVVNANSTGGSGSGSCDNQTTPTYDLKKHQANYLGMAKKLLDYLKKDNVNKIAIVARAGSDLSTEEFKNPSNQKYTHAGIAFKSSKDGRWRFKHLINVCAGSSSEIFIHSIAKFFNDDPYYYDVIVGFPSLQLQDEMIKIIESDLSNTGGSIHNTKYSNIANPFSTEYQNSNGWILALIASAQSGYENLMDIQSYYRRNGFSPSQVKIGFFRSLGANIFVANATTSDHTAEEKSSGLYNFVSAISLYSYLRIDYKEICHNSGCNRPLSQINKKNNLL